MCKKRGQRQGALLISKSLRCLVAAAAAAVLPGVLTL